MKSILFTKKDTAELVDEPMPESKAGEVRVRLARSCVSGGTERAKLIGIPDLWKKCIPCRNVAKCIRGSRLAARSRQFNSNGRT